MYVFLCFIVFITWPLLIIHTGECKHDRHRSMDSVMCGGGRKEGSQLQQHHRQHDSQTQNRCKFKFCMFCCRLLLVPIIDFKEVESSPKNYLSHRSCKHVSTQTEDSLQKYSLRECCNYFLLLAEKQATWNCQLAILKLVFSKSE